MPIGFGIIGLLAAGLWLAVLLATRFAGFRALDLRLLTAINARFGPAEGRAAHKLERAMRDLTALGGDMVTGLLLVAGTALLFTLGRAEDALRFAMLLLAARVIGLVMKAAIRRQRPQLGAQHLRAFTSSFPSVHTLMSFIVSFAILVAAGIGFAAAMGWAGLLGALVAATRLFFAVHWPSDVLAGWLTGLAICSFFAVLAA